MFVDILDVPYLDYVPEPRIRVGENRISEQGLSRLVPSPEPDSRVYKVLQSNSSGASSLRSDTPSEYDSAIHGPPEDHCNERHGPRSLDGWNRSDIEEWHREHPECPPPGTSFTQALMCAVSTTPGFEGLRVAASDGGRTLNYGTNLIFDKLHEMHQG